MKIVYFSISCFFLYTGQELAIISKLGRKMSRIPLLPRFSKMLLLANQQDIKCVQYIIAIVAALTVKVTFFQCFFRNTVTGMLRVKLFFPLKTARWRMESYNLFTAKHRALSHKFLAQISGEMP